MEMKKKRTKRNGNLFKVTFLCEEFYKVFIFIAKNILFNYLTKSISACNI